MQLLANFRKNGDVHSKAVKYYREIINAEWNVTSEKDTESKSKSSPDISNSMGNKSPVSEALFELAEVLEGMHSNTSAMSEGFAYLSRAASMGHVMAQHRLASAFATGLFGAGLIPMNAGKALMLEYMAALGGSPEAAMGMGNRYLYGIGVPENCETSKAFYEFAANVAADQIQKRGLPVHSERVKISETEVAATSGRKNIDTEVVDYYKHLVSGGGDSAAAHTLGGMYLQGSRFVEQDVAKAVFYFSIAADIGDTPASGQLGYLLAQQLVLRLNTKKEKAKKTLDGGNEDRLKEENLSVSGIQEGPKMPSKIADEVKKIKKLLRYADNRGDVHGKLGLGYLQYTGLSETAEDSAQGTFKNITGAFEAFSIASMKHSDAGFYMGEILMGRAQPSVRHPSPKAIFGPPLNRRAQIPKGTTEAEKSRLVEGSDDLSPLIPSAGVPESEIEDRQDFDRVHLDADVADQPTIMKIDPAAAFRAYAQSWQRGNLLALHRISHMAADGVGMAKSCSKAVSGFKTVAERGDWSHKLTKAHRFMDAGDKRSALALFSTLAAIGVESAQFNTAYILMKATDLPWLTLTPPSPSAPASPTKSKVADESSIEVAVTQDSFGEITATLLSATDAAAAAVAINTNADVSSGQPIERQSWKLMSTSHENGISSSDISAVDSESNSTSLRLAQAGAKANCQMRALSLYAVSASQTSAESFLRVGDCFYYGCGGLSRDRVEAAVFYQLAADLRNAHALFNLGIMHQAGDGVEQDFHLAKRFFDLAGATDIDARLPKTLALILLNAHRKMQDRFGVEATDRVLEVASKVSKVVGGYLSATIEQVLQLLPAGTPFADRGGRTWELRRASEGDFGSLLLSLQSSIKKTLSSSLSAPAAATGAEGPRAGLSDMLSLLGLSLVFLFIIRWKRRRQLQQQR
jgi:TPR repeat protein